MIAKTKIPRDIALKDTEMWMLRDTNYAAHSRVEHSYRLLVKASVFVLPMKENGFTEPST